METAHAVAEHVSEEGPQTGEVNLQPSPFTSSAFDLLPKPIPVEDIFWDVWSLKATRVLHRGLILSSSLLFLLYNIYPAFLLVTLTLIFRYVLLTAGFKAVFGIPIQSKTVLLWALFFWPQKSWEHIGTRLLLKKGHTVLTRFWWHCYLLLSDTADFRQNYMEAWRQRREQSIRISVSDELLTIPIPQVANDEVVLRRLRMFYRMVIVGQGIPGLLLPKKLERIDCIKISEDTLTLGCRTETLQLGQYKGRLTSRFRSPELGKDSKTIAEKIQSLPREIGLEFRQTYSIGIISLVLAAPPLGSAIFAVAWISIFVHKEGVELQVLVATAFTVGSYIVTTGALIIAFIAFLDQKKTQNKEMIDRFSRVDSLDQNRAQNDIIHDEPSTGTPNLESSTALGESA